MTVDFKKYDQITEIENALENLLKYTQLSDYNLAILNHENQILLLLTIQSILYKEHTKNEYLIEQFKKIKTHTAEFITYCNYNIEELMEKLDDCIFEKNMEKANIIITSYGKIIGQILLSYYNQKQKNYIKERMITDLLIETKQVVELIEFNPFIVNQLFQHKPLTQEEKFIYDITEYHEYSVPENFVEIKKLIKDNHKKDLAQIIIFILNNVYQEIMDDKTETDKLEIKSIMENKQIKNEDIIKFFIENNNFSSKYIEYFLMYNSTIKQGRLEELKHKQSYIYTRKY